MIEKNKKREGKKRERKIKIQINYLFDFLDFINEAGTI